MAKFKNKILKINKLMVRVLLQLFENIRRSFDLFDYHLENHFIGNMINTFKIFHFNKWRLFF